MKNLDIKNLSNNIDNIKKIKEKCNLVNLLLIKKSIKLYLAIFGTVLSSFMVAVLSIYFLFNEELAFKILLGILPAMLTCGAIVFFMARHKDSEFYRNIKIELQAIFSGLERKNNLRSKISLFFIKEEKELNEIRKNLTTEEIELYSQLEDSFYLKDNLNTFIYQKLKDFFDNNDNVTLLQNKKTILTIIDSLEPNSTEYKESLLLRKKIIKE